MYTRQSYRLHATLIALVVTIGVLLPEAALAATQQAAEYNASGVEAYNSRDWQNALSNFTQAYKLAPENETVRRNLCNTYQAVANERAQASDYKGAAEYLEYAISVDPENARPLVQLGTCYLRLNLVNDAIFRLEEAISVDPQNLDAHELLGDAYYRDDDIPSALVQWEWVNEVDPDRNGLDDKIAKASREDAIEYDYQKRSSRHFQVGYAPGTSGGDVRNILTVLERAYRDIGRQVGGVYPPGPIQVKLYTAEDFSHATLLGEHVGAVYDGSIRLPLADKQGRNIDGHELQRRLYHEYVHVVVRHIVGDNIPWWFNEGLAQTLSEDLTREDEERLQALYGADGQFPMGTLVEHQLTRLSPDALGLAYVQAHAAVRYLDSRYGQRGLARMLSLLAEGVEAEEALQQSYGRSYATLDKEMAQRFGQ